jgi:hypothetical protein
VKQHLIPKSLEPTVDVDDENESTPNFGMVKPFVTWN